MTAAELQRIALRLSNSGWCRHWLNFNHPQNPRTMAIQVLESGNGMRFLPVSMDDLLKLGFILEPTAWPFQFIYVIERTNEDGTPFVSEL